MKQFPGYFQHFGNEKDVSEAINYCKEWIGQRAWLRKNYIDFSQYEEEINFQLYAKKFKLFKRMEAVRLTKAVEYAAKVKAEKEYQHQMLQKGKLKRSIQTNN